MKDPDTAKENVIAHEIMHMFQYNYKEQWVSQKIIYQRNRLWTKVFNDLLNQGLITRKKTFQGYQYKWAGLFP
jgi:hypothetical protein